MVGKTQDCKLQILISLKQLWENHFPLRIQVEMEGFTIIIVSTVKGNCPDLYVSEIPGLKMYTWENPELPKKLENEMDFPALPKCLWVMFS